MGSLVVYSNELNALVFKGFNDAELKLFFAICSRLKGMGSEEVRFSYAYLRELTKEKKHYTQVEYAEVIRQMYHKLLGIRFVYEDKSKEGEINLFQGYEHSLTDHSFAISVTPKFAYMFNALEQNFTIWSLEEFVEIPGIYGKQLYRFLKQWRTVGYVSYKWSDFQTLMDIPETYESKDVTRRVVKPAVERLRKIYEFRDLEYGYRKSGKFIKSIYFKWTPEPKKYDRKIKEAMNEAKSRPLIGNKTDQYITYEDDPELVKQIVEHDRQIAASDKK